MTYEELLKHLSNECEEIPMVCPNHCSATFARSKWEEHFEQICPNITYPCPKCDKKLKKADIETHNCIKEQGQQINQLKSELEMVKQRNMS